MSFAHTVIKGIVASAVAIVMNSIPVPAQVAEPSAQVADSRDEAALLAALAQAEPAEAQRLDRQLQRLWSQSGSAAMDLLLERGREALAEDDPQAAIEHLTALTDHAPGFAEGWNVRAMAYFQVALYGPALSDLEQALALNASNYNAIIGLGAILEVVGAREQAYRAYQRAQAIHPHHEDVTTSLDRLRSGIDGKAL